MAAGFRAGLAGFLKHEFPQYGDRFKVVLEKDTFKAKEDKSMWLAKEIGVPDIAEVYLILKDGSPVFICDISENVSQDQAKIAILTGLQRVQKELERKAGFSKQ